MILTCPNFNKSMVNNDTNKNTGVIIHLYVKRAEVGRNHHLHLRITFWLAASFSFMDSDFWGLCLPITTSINISIMSHNIMWECTVENKFLRMSTTHKLFSSKGIYILNIDMLERILLLIYQILIEYFLCITVGTGITEECKTLLSQSLHSRGGDGHQKKWT